jgi:hypothetical protein
VRRSVQWPKGPVKIYACTDMCIALAARGGDWAEAAAAAAAVER